MICGWDKNEEGQEIFRFLAGQRPRSKRFLGLA